MLFDVLIHSKGWDTFVSNAAYFRQIMNEGEFVYALYVAVIHSPLAEHVLPTLYEVTPHLFTNNEVIEAAYRTKQTQKPGKFKSSFTGTKKNPEQRVAYFGEDIGLNTHHVTWHMEFPFWWDDKYSHHRDRKGENFFWVHHQLTVRFDAERLSNYLDPVDEQNSFVQSLHNTAHIVLGRQSDPHGKYDLPPGVLEHFETATRDPSFFRLHKYMDNIFKEHKDSLPPYTTEELTFTGINVDNVAIEGELETYFEDFEYNLINAVDDTEQIEDVEISTYVPRLNHKDFDFKIDVSNDKGEEVLATVRYRVHLR
ncbi:hemocyanin subunit-like [Penaeus indicus]|uniref:hemocyanin subunit-like n=1 Tax=Penaeus indicus TaxID=29960 RepID=UPI00300D9E4D